MTMMIITVFLTVIAAVLAILVKNSQTGSGIFAPPEISGSRDVFPSAKVVNLTGASGPESIAFDPAGEGPYVGVSDGRILKWRGEPLGWSDFAHTSSNSVLQECVRPFAPELEHVCGRPLGLRFDKKTGDLYIADAYFGLLVVGPAGGLAKPLVTEAEGQPFRFTNDLDIDEQEDVIYFTDTSARFQRRQFLAAVLNVDKTGRFIKYDRSSKKATVLLQGLAFANGVALSKDRSFVLVVETTTCKILRLWLSGPNAGTHQVFAELPGFPDNIRRNSNGEFWVALHSKKGLFAKLSLTQTWFRDLVLRLPISPQRLHSLFTGGIPHATAIKLSESGKVLEVLEDKEGKTLRFISEVEEKDGKLWIGSVLVPFLGVYDL
ncbi:Protein STRICTOSIDINE SYNTHASE-LIKE 10 [Arabidopsis thaliana]